MTVQVSDVLRQGENGYTTYWCQGCEEMHAIRVGPQHNPGSNWGWNGNVDKPTFTPSVLVRSGHYMDGRAGKPCYCDPPPEGEEDWGFKCEQCHTFITDGMVQFLDDCSHAFAGKTVPLPPLPESLRDPDWRRKAPIRLVK